MKNKASRAGVHLDQYFEKLRVSCKHKFQRGRFGIPENGWKTIEELEKWEKELWSSQDGKKEWDEMITATLKEIGHYSGEIDEYQQKYRKNLELFFTLDFNGAYDANLPGLPRFRGEDKYWRTKALLKRSEVIDEKTGERVTAQQVAELYDPLSSLTDKMKYIQVGKRRILLPIYDQNRADEIEKTWPQKRYDWWLNKYGIFTGDQIRKILSKHRKRFS